MILRAILFGIGVVVTALLWTYGYHGFWFYVNVGLDIFGAGSLFAAAVREDS